MNYQKVAINGLGGLGHMGVKFAVAFGAEVRRKKFYVLFVFFCESCFFGLVEI